MFKNNQSGGSVCAMYWDASTDFIFKDDCKDNS